MPIAGRFDDIFHAAAMPIAVIMLFAD